MHPQGEQDLTLPDGRKIHYLLDAEPANQPIILLANPLTATLHAWDAVVKSINNLGYRTLRYDQPGHGGSDAPSDLGSTTFDSMAEDVLQLLQGLKIQNLHGWVGVSMGASTGIYFVTKFPGIVERLAVCDTISGSPVNMGTEDLFGQRVAEARKDGSLEPTVNATLERWFGEKFLQENPEAKEHMRKTCVKTSLDGYETCCAALKSPTYDLRPLFGKVGRSVDKAVCVVGEKDANLPETMKTMAEEMEKGFKEAGKGEQKVKLEVIEEAGHVSFIDGFEQFTSVVGEFMKA